MCGQRGNVGEEQQDYEEWKYVKKKKKKMAGCILTPLDLWNSSRFAKSMIGCDSLFVCLAYFTVSVIPSCLHSHLSLQSALPNSPSLNIPVPANNSAWVISSALGLVLLSSFGKICQNVLWMTDHVSNCNLFSNSDPNPLLSVSVFQ